MRVYLGLGDGHAQLCIHGVFGSELVKFSHGLLSGNWIGMARKIESRARIPDAERCDKRADAEANRARVISGVCRHGAHLSAIRCPRGPDFKLPHYYAGPFFWPRTGAPSIDNGNAFTSRAEPRVR